MRSIGHPDIVILAASLLLVAFGLTMVLCASAAMNGQDARSTFFDRQLDRAMIGIGAMIAAYLLRPSWVEKLAPIGFVAASVMVAMTLTSAGIGPDGQITHRWLSVMQTTFQPSEILKLALVVQLARILSKRGPALKTLRGALSPMLIVIVLAGLVALQPNMGVSAAVLAIGFGLVFIAGVRLVHLLMVGAPLCVAVVLRVLSVPYECRRLMAFLHRDTIDPQVEGYQLNQSLIALGSGGFYGRGFGESLQKFSFLPAPHTDFIFSIIGEEGGFIVAVLVLGIYALIVGRAFKLSARTHNAFGGYVAAGVGLMIGVQVLMNVAVVTGAMPTTGLPLPFLSYGGSSLVVHLAAVGLLLRLTSEALDTQRTPPLAREAAR